MMMSILLCYIDGLLSAAISDELLVMQGPCYASYACLPIFNYGRAGFDTTRDAKNLHAPLRA